MSKYMTFTEFLSCRVNRFEVDDRLLPGIEDLDAADLDDPNNLFAVSPHFLKCCHGEPQDILEALVVAYNWWLLSNLKAMADPAEWCKTANRVIFIEGAQSESTELWKGMNTSLAELSGCLEDLMVQCNYMNVSRHASQREE